jgi:hypothetical protein
MIVINVAPISPSSDFFGLTLGASGRWKNDPPQTEPTRNAHVSKMNVRRSRPPPAPCRRPPMSGSEG